MSCTEGFSARARFTRTSSTLALLNASSQLSIRGLPLMGNMHFGVVLVSGQSRLPIPAASRKAFTSFSSCVQAILLRNWGFADRCRIAMTKTPYLK